MSNLKLCAFADESSPEINGQIDALNRNKIEFLEIRNVDGTNIADISNETAKEVSNRLANGGVKVWSLGSPFGKIGIKDDFEPHLDLFKKSLENAEILGAKCIRLFSFFTEDHSEAVRDEVFERLSKFVDAAKGCGIILCHENEKGIYGDIAPRCLEIHKQFADIKCVFDPANYVQCGQDTLEAWEMLKNYIYYLHIKDANAKGTIVPAGNGVGNIEKIVKAFSSMGGGVMTLEPHLMTFDGLDALEGGHKTEIENFVYKTNEEAFDAGAAAIKAIIERV